MEFYDIALEGTEKPWALVSMIIKEQVIEKIVHYLTSRNQHWNFYPK